MKQVLMCAVMLTLYHTVCGDVDVSAHVDCGVTDFVDQNRRLCYRRRIEGDVCNPINCTTRRIPRTDFNITFQSSTLGGPIQTKFWTPGKIRNPPRNYQNNRLCQYHTVCPPGQLLHYGFRTGNMDLEPEDSTQRLCLDYVFIENFSEESVQICGSHNESSARRAAPLRVEFRSNSRGRYPGFQIDVICVRPQFANLPGCKESIDANSTSVPSPAPIQGRRKRALQKDKRAVIPLTGNTLSLPRDGYLLYKNNRLQVISDNTVAREFLNIRRLFFWTGFNGTRVFHKSTDEFVYGAGVLKIVRDCAYYHTFDIPPKLEPTSADLKLISLLLNATAPFFSEEDILDVDTTSAFPSHLGLHSGSTGGLSLPHKPLPIGKKRRRRSNVYPPYIDPRVNVEALGAAVNWQNACSIFLRESALSYLLILAEQGLLP